MLSRKKIVIPFVILLIITVIFVLAFILTIGKIDVAFIPQLQMIMAFLYSISAIGITGFIIYSFTKIHNEPINKIISKLNEGINTKFENKIEIADIEGENKLNELIEKINVSQEVIKLQKENKIEKIISKIDEGINTNFKQKVEINKIEGENKLNELIEKINVSQEIIKEREVKQKKEADKFKNQFEYLQFSNEIGKFILSKLTVEEIIINVYNELGVIFPMNTFSIGLADKEKGVLKLWKINAINNRLQRSTESLKNDESLALFCFKNTKEVFINDYRTEHKKIHIKVSNTISLNKAMIYMPLISVTDRTVGMISVKAKKANTYQPYHLEIFRNLATYIVNALENSKVYKQLDDQKTEISERNEELNQQREEIININEHLTDQKEKLENALRDIELLGKIGQDITASLEVTEITKIVHLNLEKLIDAPYFGIGVFDGESKLVFKNVIENDRFLPQFEAEVNNSESIASYSFNNFKEVIINDIETEYNKYLKEKPSPVAGDMTYSIIYLPLATKGVKQGVLSVQSYNKNAYTEHDVFILKSLASYIAIAISNANAFEEIERNQKQIQGLANQLEKQFGELQKSEAKMTNIINFLPDATLVLDKDGKLEVWNKSMERLTGIKADDILGVQNYEHSLAFYDERRPMLADILLNPTEKMEEQYANLDVSEKLISGQAYVPKLNKYLWGSAGLLYDSKGEILGAIQVSKDITEEKEKNDKIKEANKLLSLKNSEIEKQKEEILKNQTELKKIVEELKATNQKVEEANRDLERLSLVASKTDNAVIIMDSIANINWVNDAFTRLYGYTKNEFILKRGISWLEACYNPDIKDILSQTVRSRKSSVYISKIEKEGKPTKWFQTTLTPIYDKENQLKNFIAVQTDITETKEAEKEIAIQNKKIRQSIKYARRIQTAVLPQKRFIERTLAEHFILYKPRDIVSGDFYWITRKKTKLLIAAADSTGHGVPGAFMSMLGISFLNEIANSFFEKNGLEGLQASKILNQLRTDIIKSLHQKLNTEAKDGIDIALCVFDLDTQEMQYAGANNPLYLIRKKTEEAIRVDERYLKKIETENSILYEIKADKKPIGIGRNYEEKFQNKDFRVRKGDRIYLFSDGYIDQFGGPKQRKFLSSNFKKLLLKIHKEPMFVQERILDKKIKDWMQYPKPNGKPHSQIDDILVMGLRF